jgi:voltage-gated potassium channel
MSVQAPFPERPQGRLRSLSDANTTLRKRVFRLLEPSRDGNDASWYLGAFLVAVILVNIIAVVIESIDPVDNLYGGAFRLLEAFSVAVFTLEYLARLWVSVETVEAQPRSAAAAWWRYVMSPMAIIDLLSVAPFFLAGFGIIGQGDARLLRVLRLLRLFKLTRYADSMALLGEVLQENAKNFATAFGVLMIAMILAASAMYLIEREVQPEAFGSIPAAMWWAFATLTTVGYGDVTPVTAVGKLFGAGITVVSIGIVALPAGLLASSFSARLRQKSETYRDAADRVLADGVITGDEAVALEQQREKLGLGEGLAASILELEHSRTVVGVKFAGPWNARDHVCPECGQLVAQSDTEAPD